MNKFGKNREVDPRYLNVPVKYITHFTGSNEDGKDKYEPIPFEEWKKKMEEWDKLVELPGREYTIEGYEAWKKYCEENGYGYHYKRLVREGKDKTLCIVDFYGKNKALVAWRNNRTCKMGMTRICRVIEENGKTYIQYRGKNILISDPNGWVF